MNILNRQVGGGRRLVTDQRASVSDHRGSRQQRSGPVVPVNSD